MVRTPRLGAALVAAAVVAAMLAAGISAGHPAAAQSGPDPTTTTTVPDTTTTTVAPAPAPLAPTLADLFPGIDPSITPEQLAAFFRFLAGPPVPAGSGSGRRIVYANGAQRVWLVDEAEQVVRTYRVSGRGGMPRPGVYRIFSTSRYSSSGAVRMEHMMRFARGRRLAIGFHSIPVRRNGTPIQTLGQLGTPLSHGCVRQSPADAAFLWTWAGVGTVVVVLP